MAAWLAPAAPAWWDTGARSATQPPFGDCTVILEIADIRIQPGQNAGFQGATVNACIESPERYVLQIRWATLEDHTVGFRQGPLFTEWRAIVGPFFAQPPLVEHFQLTTTV